MTPQLQQIFNDLAAGKWVCAGAADNPEVAHLLDNCADMCHKYNMLAPSGKEQRSALLSQLLAGVGDNAVIHSPFRCDLGFNITIGDNFVGNFNLAILDEAPVTIGNNVMIGPNCTIVTIEHAADSKDRARGIMKAAPVTINDDVWLAAGVTVLPGVTIGARTIVGAGSVVTKSLPADVVAFGNPCRIHRHL